MSSTFTTPAPTLKHALGRRVMTLSCIALAFLSVGCSDGSDNRSVSCTRPADDAARVATARALVTVDAASYENVIGYWAEDVFYLEPVLSSSGRDEVLEYFQAMFSGSAYGFPLDRQVAIVDELHTTDSDGHMSYMATIEWTGSFNAQIYSQAGMSIVKFRPGEGCAYYQRDYATEGDSWWNIPAFKADVNTFRNMYISLFGLSGRCFDDDGDGYPKYESSKGCPNSELDCNDFVASINPGAMEIQGNGVDEDCDVLTPINTTDPQMQSSQ